MCNPLKGGRIQAALLTSLVLHMMLLMAVSPSQRQGGAVLRSKGLPKLTVQLAPRGSVVLPQQQDGRPVFALTSADAAMTEAATGTREPVREPELAHKPSVALLPDFLPASMLDEMPRAVAVANPDPPPDADPLLGGRLKIKLWIDAAGTVRAARVMDSGGLPAAYADAARKAFLRSTFVPGQRNGEPVSSVVSIIVEYEQLAAPTN